jgi:hypothetical protein
MDIFEKATRKNILFDTSKGVLNVIDLWRLPLTAPSGKVSLDAIACQLHEQLQSSPTISFVRKVEEGDADLKLAFAVVKHIIDVKLVEQETASQNRLRNEKKQQIMALISQKENEALAEKSLDDLRALMEGM